MPFYGGASYRTWRQTTDGSGPARKIVRWAHDSSSPAARAGGHLLSRPSPAGARTRSRRSYPFRLIYGQSLYYWHQNVLIKHSATLKREYHILLLDYPEGFVEINDQDAKRLGIRDGEKIRVRSAQGMALVAARVTAEVRPGTVSVPHFVRQVQRQIQGGNSQPLEQAPVRIEKEVS